MNKYKEQFLLIVLQLQNHHRHLRNLHLLMKQYLLLLRLLM